MKKYNLAIFFISLFFIFSTHNAYSQNGWFLQYYSGLPQNANSIFFLDAQTGWVVQDSNIVYKTTTGGQYWDLYDLPFKCHLESIYFVNEMTGWICGGRIAPIPMFTSGNYFKTTNGGINWTHSGSIAQVYYKDVFFINNNTGFMAVDWPQENSTRGYVNKTINSGATWEHAFDIIDYYAYSFSEIKFVNQTTGYALGRYMTEFLTDTTIVMRTQNSGQTWEKIFQTQRGAVTTPINTFDAFGNYAWLLAYNKLFYSTNSGANWQERSLNFNVYTNMYFVNQNTGWITRVPSGSPDTLNLYKSTNGGLNWTGYRNPLGNLNDIFFVNEYTGWATTAGYQLNVNILKSVTGGIMALEYISQTLVSNYILHQNFPNPFNPTTKIRFEVPNSNASSYILLKVYDINGKLISELFNGKLSGGVYEIDWNAGNLPSGAYFYSLISEDFKEVRKMILMK
jgi:photosystem II stability/assembly factor-like uncharacterized protein